jgi:hypothetical protein
MLRCALRVKMYTQNIDRQTTMRLDRKLQRREELTKDDIETLLYILHTYKNPT